MPDISKFSFSDTASSDTSHASGKAKSFNARENIRASEGPTGRFNKVKRIARAETRTQPVSSNAKIFDLSSYSSHIFRINVYFLSCMVVRIARHSSNPKSRISCENWPERLPTQAAWLSRHRPRARIGGFGQAQRDWEESFGKQLCHQANPAYGRLRKSLPRPPSRKSKPCWRQVYSNAIANPKSIGDYKAILAKNLSSKGHVSACSSQQVYS